MAINFLNNINLNSIQIENIVIEKFASDAAAGTGVVGQLYFDTTADTLKQYVSDTGGGAAGWIEVGTTSGVETITTTDGTYIDLTPNTPTLGNVTVTADLSAVDGTSIASDRFLTKNNKWATIPFGDITEVQGGTYINVTNQTGPIPIVNHDLTSRTDTTSTASPASGATFTAIDSVTTNTTGHVTALNVKTVTLPPEIDTTYTLPVTTLSGNQARISLTPSAGAVASTVDFIGTTGRIAITKQVQNNGSITVDFPDDVIIVDDLQVGGELTVLGTGQSSFGGQVTIPLVPVVDADAASKRYVDQSNIGQSVFQGGYNANTNTPDLDVSPATDIKKGFFWAVTVGGTFFSEVVQPGDLIYANQDNPGATFSNWVVVQSGQDIATANTEPLAIRGISAYDSTYFNVNGTGWATLKSQANANGVSQTLDNTTPVSRVEANGLTTFTIDLEDTSLFGPNALAKNVTVEITQNVSPFQTVYADVTRSGSGDISIIFSGSVAVDIYRVLLTHV